MLVVVLVALVAGATNRPGLPLSCDATGARAAAVLAIVISAVSAAMAHRFPARLVSVPVIGVATLRRAARMRNLLRPSVRRGARMFLAQWRGSWKAGGVSTSRAVVEREPA